MRLLRNGTGPSWSDGVQVLRAELQEQGMQQADDGLHGDRPEQSTADRDEEVITLRAIAGRNPVALGQIEKVLTERLQEFREAGQEGEGAEASDRLLLLVEYGLQQEKGAPVEQWISDRLDKLDPGRHVATADGAVAARDEKAQAAQTFGERNGGRQAQEGKGPLHV